MDRISATIITRNEEAQIERCLNSLYGVADEIIVVDSYSSDRTTEICNRYGCKITSRPFTGFGSQRQYAVGLAENTYILAVDADEVLSEDLRNELMSMKAKGFEHRIYSIQVINYFCGTPINHSGWRPFRDIRLFNKRYANWNLSEVGERVTFDPLLIPCTINSGHIDHYRVNTHEEFTKKEHRRSSMQARVIASSNNSISILTPTVRACLDLFSCYVKQAAFLDGQHGNTIALHRFASTFKAYSIARSLIKRKRTLR